MLKKCITVVSVMLALVLSLIIICEISDAQAMGGGTITAAQTGKTQDTSPQETTIQAIPLSKLTIIDKVTYEDLEDEEQTVHCPAIKTTASDANGNKDFYAHDTVSVVDTIEYKNLAVGLRYTVEGTLMDKATGKAITDEKGEAITAKEEFDAVIDALRNDHLHGGILESRNGMAAFCRKHSESKMKNDERSYGVRVDTEKRAYLLRLNPHPGEYNLYCYCYIKKWLDGHLQQAEKGIRFTDPNNKELFRIPDGDEIRIIYADGKKDDRICRYVDDYHVEIGSGWNSLLHICQFAEMMEQTSSTVIPLRSSLPEQCYSVLPGSGKLIVIKKGESGYYRTDIDMGGKTENRALADEYNAKLGVSKAQEQAMFAGSMFGFQVPAADPQNYDDQGWPRIAGSHPVKT